MRKLILTGLVAATALGLSACSEKAQDQIEQAGNTVGSDLERGINNADDKVQAGLQDAGAAIDDAGNKIGSAASDAGDKADKQAREAKKDAGAALEDAGKDLKEE